MMSGALLVSALTVVKVSACPQRVEAQEFWAWIKELSGPGPFNGPQFDVRLVCFGKMLTEDDYRKRVEVAASAADRARATSELERFQKTQKGELGVSLAATVSDCPYAKRVKPFAIGAGARFMSYTDDSETNAYAGGNTIRLQTYSGHFTWRPLNSITHGKLDLVDLGIGAGYYRFTSGDEQLGGFSD